MKVTVLRLIRLRLSTEIAKVSIDDYRYSKLTQPKLEKFGCFYYSTEMRHLN